MAKFSLTEFLLVPKIAIELVGMYPNKLLRCFRTGFKLIVSALNDSVITIAAKEVILLNLAILRISFSICSRIYLSL